MNALRHTSPYLLLCCLCLLSSTARAQQPGSLLVQPHSGGAPPSTAFDLEIVRRGAAQDPHFSCKDCPPAPILLDLLPGTYAAYAQDRQSGIILRFPVAGEGVEIRPGGTDTLKLDLDFSTPFRQNMDNLQEELNASAKALPGRERQAPREILVRFAPETPISRIYGLNTRSGSRIRKRGRLSPTYRIQPPADLSLDEILQHYRREAGVLYAEASQIYRIAGEFPAEIDSSSSADHQWARHEHDADRDIDLPQAWALEQGHEEVLMVIIDSGVDTAHVDLQQRLWRNDPPGDPDGNGDPDDDGNGLRDDYYGWYFDSAGLGSPDISDPHGHGTHIAGICGAEPDNAGIPHVVGLSWHSPIVVVKLNFSFNTDLEIAEAIRYGAATAHSRGKGCVINMSFGASEPSTTLREAVAFADSLGAVLVAAAGNNSANSLLYPAAFPQVISVSNIERGEFDILGNGRKAPVLKFRANANYHAELDLAAPGTTIWSSLPGNHVALNNSGYNTQADFLSGTSQAAAFVAGTAALVMSAARRHGVLLTPQEVRDILRRSASYGGPSTPPYLHDPNRDGVDDTLESTLLDETGEPLRRNPFVGFGVLNTLAALKKVLPPATTAHSFELSPGWHLISLPVAPRDNALENLFPDGLAAFRFQRGYVAAPRLVPGPGYWIKLATGGTYLIEGAAVENLALNLQRGWNLVGAPAADTPLANFAQQPRDIVVAAFGFSGRYQRAEALESGRGYWINARSPGQLEMPPPIAAKVLAPAADGKSVTGSSRWTASPGKYRLPYPQSVEISTAAELPPPPPTGLVPTRSLGEKNLLLPYHLAQNYPNPFNHQTLIRCRLEEAGNLQLKIYDALGQLVRVLADEWVRAGHFSRTWDGYDERGKEMAGGLYFCELEIAGYRARRKMLLVK